MLCVNSQLTQNIVVSVPIYHILVAFDLRAGCVLSRKIGDVSRDRGWTCPQEVRLVAVGKRFLQIKDSALG